MCSPRVAMCLCVCSGLVLFARASGPASRPGDPRVREFLDRARQELSATGSSPEWTATYSILETYARGGMFEEAREFIRQQPRDSQDAMLLCLAGSYLEAGREEDALKVIQDYSDRQGGLGLMAVSQIRRNLPQALRLVGMLEKGTRWQQALCGAIAEELVRRGDLGGAEKRLAEITRPDTKEEVQTWIAAARALQAPGPLQDALAKAGLDAQAAGDPLQKMAIDAAEGGNLALARRAAEILLPDARALVSAVIAEAYRRKGKADQCREWLAKALKETATIKPEAFRSGPYLAIVRTQVLAGDMEGCRETWTLLRGSRESDGLRKMTGVGIFEIFGGDVALVELMVEAGRTEEALQAATAKDGTIIPGAVPAMVKAFYATGQDRRAQAMEKSATTPEARLYLFVAAARGILESKGKAQTKPTR